MGKLFIEHQILLIIFTFTLNTRKKNKKELIKKQLNQSINLSVVERFLKPGGH